MRLQAATISDILDYLVKEIDLYQGKVRESQGILKSHVRGNHNFCTILLLRPETFAILLVLHVQLSFFYTCLHLIST